MIRSFVHGCNNGNLFTVKHPFCANCHARSEWLTAYHSAMLEIGKASLRNALLVPSTVALISFCYIFLQSAFIISNSKFLSLVSFLLVFNLSGYGFIRWFYADNRKEINADFVTDWGNGIYTIWPHPILLYIIPFRSTPFVLWAFVSILLQILLSGTTTKLKDDEIDTQESRMDSYKWYYTVGALIGLTAPLQNQGFFSLLTYVAGYLLITFLDKKSRKNIKPILERISLSFLIFATIPLINFRKLYLDGPWYQRIPISTNLKNEGYFYAEYYIWFQCLGFFPLFALVICWFFLDKEQIKIYLPTIPVFLICCLIQMQYYVNFNIKYLYPTWGVLASIMVPIVLRNIASKIKDEEVQGSFIALSLILVFTTVVSSFMGLNRQWKNYSPKWNEQYEKVAEHLIKNTNRNAVFYSSGYLYNPVTILAGRTLFKSHERDLFELGFNWNKVSDSMKTLQTRLESGEEISVDYYFEDTSHPDNFIKAKADFWDQVFIYENFQIYTHKNGAKKAI